MAANMAEANSWFLKLKHGRMSSAKILARNGVVESKAGLSIHDENSENAIGSIFSRVMLTRDVVGVSELCGVLGQGCGSGMLAASLTLAERLSLGGVDAPPAPKLERAPMNEELSTLFVEVPP